MEPASIKYMVEEEIKRNAGEASGYKNALEISSIVSLTDLKGTIQYVNDNLCNISKYSREELKGQDHGIFNAGFHTPKFIRDLWMTIKRGRIWRGEIKNKARDGSYYWVDTTIIPFLDEAGKPWQYLTTQTDVTVGKTVEALKKALKELTFKYQQKEECAGELLIANRLLAFQMEEKEARTAALMAAYNDLKKAGEDTRISNEAALKKLWDESQQQLIEHSAELKCINNELELFSYSISHDLRAPLRSVSGYSLILEEDYGALFDEEGKRLLNIVQDSASTMEILIEDLLEFSRLGKRQINQSMINMNELVKDTVDEFRAVPHFKTTIKIGDLHPCTADYLMMKQVWVNILSNAIKFSSNSEHPLIEIQSEKKNGSLIYAVTDNGVGFDMLYADKLFGVFQQLHNGQDFEGTGIGLALAHRILTKHGGRIWAHAEPGKGATFSFCLPEKTFK